MAVCPQLCTAEKCQELEERIAVLENLIQVLETNLNLHLTQDIPTAHRVNSSVNVSTVLSGNALRTQVEVENIGVNSDTVELPFCSIEACDRIERKIDSHLTLAVPTAHRIDTAMDVNVDIVDRELRVQVELQDIAVNSDTAILPTFEAPEPPPAPEVFLDIFDVGDNNYLFKVSVDGSTDEDTLRLSIPEIPEPSPPTVLVDVFRTAPNRYGVQITVNGQSDTDYFSVDIPDMDFTQLEELIRTNFDNLNSSLLNEFNLVNDGFNQIQTEFNNINLDLDGINSDLNQIEQAVTVTVSGTVDKGECSEILKDENGNAILDENNNLRFTDPYYETIELINYSDRGILGLNQAIGLLTNKLTDIHEDICKAQREPKISINLLDLIPRDCLPNIEAQQQQAQDESFYEESPTETDIFNQNKATITAFLENTPYAEFIDQVIYDPTTGANYTARNKASQIITLQLISLLKQEQTTFDELCTKINELEPEEVVTLVASDDYIPYIRTKILVFHLTEEQNYPVRGSNNSMWRLQVPAPRETFTWLDDFNDVRKITGNQYAELQFNERYIPVKGYFRDEAAANDFFDKVMTLTTATEKNRNFPKHSNPQVNPIVRTLRPYRVFISQIDENQDPKTIEVYYPVLENANS